MFLKAKFLMVLFLASILVFSMSTTVLSVQTIADDDTSTFSTQADTTEDISVFSAQTVTEENTNNPASPSNVADKLNVVLVIDVSSSMQNDTETYEVVNAVRNFVNKFPANGSVLSIVVFTGTSEIIAEGYTFADEQAKAGFESRINKLEEKIEYYNKFQEGLNGTAVVAGMKSGADLLAEHQYNAEYLTAMLLYTDGVNSASASSDESWELGNFRDGEYGSYPIYVLELYTGGANARLGETKLNLSDLGNKNGGRWIEELNVENISERFRSILNELEEKTNQSKNAEQPLAQTDPHDQTDQPDPQPAGSVTSLEITSNPEGSMLAHPNSELVVQVLLKQESDGVSTVISDESIYQSYMVTFYIKKSTDKNFRTADMDIIGGSYKTRYQLPAGEYEFYAKLSHDVVKLHSETRHIVVREPIPKDTGIPFIRSPDESTIRQDKAGEEGVKLEFFAYLPEGYTDEFYYENYIADLHVLRDKEVVEKVGMVVQHQDSATHFACDYEITEPGPYSFKVEVSPYVAKDDENLFSSVTKELTYRKAPPSLIVLIELLIAAGIPILIFIRRGMFFPRFHKGFLQYEIRTIDGSSISNQVSMKEYYGSQTLKDLMGDDSEKLTNKDWLLFVEMKPAAKGISVTVKGNIQAELDTGKKKIQKKKLLMHSGDCLTLKIGDYRAELDYSTSE